MRRLICETKLPMKEPEMKAPGGGGLIHERGGVNAGFYSTILIHVGSNYKGMQWLPCK